MDGLLVRVRRVRFRLGVFFVTYILLLFISLLIIFIDLFFALTNIGKVRTGVLARVQAQSPGSSPCAIPGSNPGFDVSLSRMIVR